MVMFLKKHVLLPFFLDKTKRTFLLKLQRTKALRHLIPALIIQAARGFVFSSYYLIYQNFLCDPFPTLKILNAPLAAYFKYIMQEQFLNN